MNIRKFKLLIVVFFISSLFVSFGLNRDSDPKDKVLITILKYVLTQGHYHPQDIDDRFSENIFESFIDRMDHSKLYFLQSDIDEFAKYKKEIDDQIKNEDLSFFYLVYERYIQRTDETKTYYQQLLTNAFDFNKEETLNVDYEDSNYAQNKNQIISLWHKQLKFSTLINLHDEITQEEDKKKEDPTYVIKPFKELEILARETTLTNMNESFSRMKELTYTDWFSTFASCISEEFDPHTSYLNPAFKKSFDISMAGRLEGIGARLQKRNNYTKVTELVSGGPAWKQGELEVEDLILKVGQGDEEPMDIVGMRLDNAIEFIKGKKGTEVRLTVKKVDGTIKVISIIRDVVELEETFVKSSIVKKENHSYAVINLPQFYIDFDEKNYRNSATDMAKEIERLKKENVSGLVLDLRNNGGGSLTTAIDISGLFIEKGPVVQVKYRDKAPKIVNDKDAKIQWDGPLVILVNELSASASEIFAAAMQDYGRAVIIGGKQTYGKGTVQSIYDLNKYHNLEEDIGALKMTIQKFYRINGGSTQLEGVHSDIKLPSRYSYMNIGERDLDGALKFDKVPEATYNLWNNYENMDQVINNSKKRISSSAHFKLIDNHAKWLKKSQDDSVVHLNYEMYKDDLDSHKEESKKYEAIRDYSTSLTFESPLYEQDLIKQNEDLANKREAWHKNLKKDIYMEEAINVLSELKIKPEHQLVKANH
jgi:carboxyl-terminal processing protease